MKKRIVLICVGLMFSSLMFSQEYKASKKANPIIADTSSYEVVENINNINVHADLEIRKKISHYRKKDVDFLLDFGNGLKVLIYKEEE